MFSENAVPNGVRGIDVLPDVEFARLLGTGASGREVMISDEKKSAKIELDTGDAFSSLDMANLGTPLRVEDFAAVPAVQASTGLAGVPAYLTDTQLAAYADMLGDVDMGAGHDEEDDDSELGLSAAFEAAESLTSAPHSPYSGAMSPLAEAEADAETFAHAAVSETAVTEAAAAASTTTGRRSRAKAGARAKKEDPSPSSAAATSAAGANKKKRRSGASGSARRRRDRLLTPEQVADKKYRNKLAAERFRARKRAKQEEVENRASVLEEENAKLKATVASLQHDLAMLRSLFTSSAPQMQNLKY